jgi:hypothetical protein
MTRTAFLLAAAIMLTGCLTDQAAETDADSIARNVPRNYRATKAAYLRKVLKDPESVRDPEISNVTVVHDMRFGGPSVCVPECT